MDNEFDLQIGDLIKVLNVCEAENYIFRPYGFPYDKVGLVTKLHFEVQNDTTDFEVDPALYPYDYDFRTYYGDLIEVLVDGRKYWVFLDEIQTLNQD